MTLAFALLLTLYTDNHGLRCVVTWDGPHVTLRHEAMHGDGHMLPNGEIHVVWHDTDGTPAARAVYRLDGSQFVGSYDGFESPGRTERHWMVRKQR